MNREKTIDRIKKLLELAANNPSESEATAAALKAQRLIAEHNVADSELMKTAEEAIAEIRSGNYKGNPWAVRLAHAIADNFRCRLYLAYTGTKSWWTGRTTKDSQQVVFMGYETDAQAATETFNRLFEIGNKLANAEARRVRRCNGTASGVKNSCLLGYVNGIRTELEKQTTALVLVRPKAVNDYADEVTSGFKTSRSTLRNAYENDSYGRGQSAGRDAMRGGRIGGQMALES